MKRINRLYIKSIFSALVISLLSCSDDFLTKEPKGVVVADLLNTPKGVDNLLIGAYSLLDGAGSSNGFPSYAYPASIRNWVWDCASDDAYKGTTLGDFATGGEVERYEALPTNQLIEQKWYVMYDGVSRANDVLKALAKAKVNMSEANVNVLSAQARFLRGFFHFRLQQMHFQIPYITEDVADPALVKNDHPVWDEVETDLQFAIDNLPESFPGEPGRATKWAAMAAKAHVHLFQKEFPAAKILLDAIIASGKFALVDNFRDNYTASTENNKESVFEIQSAVNDGTSQGFNGNPDSWTTNPYNRFLPTCCGMYQPSQDLVNAFKVDKDGLPLLGIGGPKYNDTNLKNDMGINSADNFVPDTHLLDPRLDWTVGRRGIPYLDWGINTGNEWVRDQVNGGPYIPIKQMFTKAAQKDASHTTFARATAINYRLYRYAHILLWRAECAIEENDLPKAMQLINQVRKRASDDFVMGKVNTYAFPSSVTIDVDYTKPAANYLLGEYKTFPSQAYAREALQMELRLETAMEGNRFFDLVRWEKDAEVLTKFVENDSKFRVFMKGAQYKKGVNDHWPIPQSQIDIQKGVLIQDPAF
ncbi:RagB/SusD family nutrient uptake outer membrane protein [Dyadobacter bucti]|uniref:RagB/SusD family nutrient uptake outer membrane protein n=1 Tax=Dyadobacter bucti TaxID=2572203 RepID=UPI003F6F33F9